MTGMPQILLTLSYDGTDYAGWQRQANAVTVQQKLEEALSALFSYPITVRGASRTDSGVHALGQRAAFSTGLLDGSLKVPPAKLDGPVTKLDGPLKIPLAKLPAVVNALLPPDIVVTRAEEVPEAFNPRHAKQKTYEYKIYNADYPNPLTRRYSAFVSRSLGIEAMKKAARMFAGRHDFKAFCAVGGNGSANGETNTVREIFDCGVSCEGGLITLTVTGGGFLYNMVRILAGTVLYAGLGKILPDDIPRVIASRDRTQAGKTMPPEGLTLMNVEY